MSEYVNRASVGNSPGPPKPREDPRLSADKVNTFLRHPDWYHAGDGRNYPDGRGQSLRQVTIEHQLRHVDNVFATSTSTRQHGSGGGSHHSTATTSSRGGRQ